MHRDGFLHLSKDFISKAEKGTKTMQVLGLAIIYYALW